MSRVTRLSEIFRQASELRIKRDRIDFLRANVNPLMQLIVQGAYHPNIVWLLPKGVPPHRAASPVGTDGELHRWVRKFYLFYEGGAPNLAQAVREKQFIRMLETLHPEDVKLVCDMKDKKISYPFLTYGLFREAFPDWLPEEPEDVYVPINERPENKRFKKVKKEEASA
jgi:hypothetical protein